MLEERFRLVYLSKNSTDIKQITLTSNKFWIAVTFLTILVVGLSVLGIGLFTRVYHNFRVVSLENDKEHLEKELLQLKYRVSAINNRLAEVEETGDVLRNVANLDPIDQDTRQVGVGGPVSSSLLEANYFSDEITKTTTELNLDLEKFERVILLEKHSLAEIEARLNNLKDERDHFPSIRPVLGGRITSNFGRRIDPFTKKISTHDGIDFGGRLGTPILAVADGVVKTAKTLYTPHKNYGREIVIDHGHGYETRYAHLSRVKVRRGQKVSRWDVIGEMGATGRALGEHLHYEVLYKGKAQNPRNFIYN